MRDITVIKIAYLMPSLGTCLCSSSEAFPSCPATYGHMCFGWGRGAPSAGDFPPITPTCSCPLDLMRRRASLLVTTRPLVAHVQIHALPPAEHVRPGLVDNQRFSLLQPRKPRARTRSWYLMTARCIASPGASVRTRRNAIFELLEWQRVGTKYPVIGWGPGKPVACRSRAANQASPVAK